MPTRAKAFCRHYGCGAEATANGYCEAHQSDHAEKIRVDTTDRHKGTASSRGYGRRWQKYAQLFLRRPENMLCALRLDARCNRLAQCVDHIDPPDGPGDPRFWDPKNHQPACIHCNSVKGHKYIPGDFDLREVLKR